MNRATQAACLAAAVVLCGLAVAGDLRQGAGATARRARPESAGIPQVGGGPSRGDRTRQWDVVKEALQKGLPKTAIDALDPIVEGALRDRAYPEAIRAITQRITLEAQIQGAKPEEKITRLKAEIARAPQPMRPIMQAILAQWFWQYFRDNRWRHLDRTPTAGSTGDDITTWDLPRIYAEIGAQFTRALGAADLLKRTPIAEYDALLDRGNVPDAYRPTLYDFVAFHAIEFYVSGEQAAARPEDAFELSAESPIFAPAEEFVRWRVPDADGSPIVSAIRIYQELLRFHAGDRDPGALIDADLWRLRFGNNLASGEAKAARHKEALERLARRYANHELSALALQEWAAALHQEGDYVSAREIALRGMHRFPESTGGKACFNLVQQIEAPLLGAATERVWNEPLPTIDLRYKNLVRVHLRIVPFDFEEWVRSPNYRRFFDPDRVGLRELLAKKPRPQWSADLPETKDFKERLERLPAPAGVPPGSYYLIASIDPEFSIDKPIQIATFWVSDLALVVRGGENGTIEGFVLEAASGAPVPDARIRSWHYEAAKRSEGPGTRTDEDGRFRLAADPRGSILLASAGHRRLATENEYRSGESGPLREYRRTLVFTDRALYRPGQTIHYKGLCIDVDAERDRYQVLAGEKLTAVFTDGNGKEVARQEHRTNDYGSFSGTFTAPRDRLLGQMVVRVHDGPPGEATLNVEEYKRPKFNVVLEAPQEARLRMRVTLAGKAAAYTGAAIDGAEVRWRVRREVHYPLWRPWGRGWPRPTAANQEIGHGHTSTGADGTFSLSFTATPDAAIAEDENPTFHYAVHVDVTDPAGETRSADRVVRVGYVALSAGLSAVDWQVRDRPVEITVATSTLDGEPLAAEGVLEVHRLKEPQRVTRPPLTSPEWREPLGLQQGDAKPEMDPSDPTTWPEEKALLERAVATDTTGRTKVSVPLPVGLYRARLRTHDRFGKAVTAELPLRVLDRDANRCQIKLPEVLAVPKGTVEPGEEFIALWGSGYEKARAYVEVVHRGRTLQAYWTDPGRTQVLIRQPVDESMRGGFTVRVTLVRENRAYLHTIPVEVPWSNKRLTVKWEHFVSKLEPGRRETWTAVVGGPDATRASAEVVAALYDASLDAYRANYWPTLFDLFRRDGSGMPYGFENRTARFTQVSGGWGGAYKDAGIGYRRYPEFVGSRGWSSVGWAGSSSTSYYRGGRGDEIEVQSETRATWGSVRGLLSDAAPPTMPAALQSAAVSAGAGMNYLDRSTQAHGSDSRGPDLSQVSARKNLQETAFFFPHLLSDRNGEVRLEFTMPEALTAWRFMGFAHDRELRSGVLEDRAVTTRELMVQPNPPRFLREDDVLEFTVKVTNRSEARQTGRVRLTLADARTGQPVDEALGNTTAELEFAVPAMESRTFAWRLQVPDGTGFLSYKAVASTERVSDGEEGYLPVLSRRILVTESLPLPIRGPGTRQFDFERLRGSAGSTTLRHQGLTVQMASNPSWYAVMALPYLMEFPYECSEQTFNRLYANALAQHIAAADPKIRAVFEKWRGTPALDSPLEKNEDLKSVLLEETPWLRQAQAESQARRNVGILFDGDRLEGETARLQRKLAEQQLQDGAWPWFPGGRANDYITLYITTGFGRLRHLGVQIDATPAIRSLNRLDSWMDGIYQDILRHGDREANHLSPTIALYLYGRSFFRADRAVAKEHQEAFDYWLDQAKQFWVPLGDRQSQAHLAVALKRFGDRTTARQITASLKERSVRDEELGMFWRDQELSWWWYRAPIETQAMMIEAFDEVAYDSIAVEECKVWLLKQKQTRDWKTSKATADAIYALLLRGTDILAADAPVEISLGGRVVAPEAVEAGTGFYEQRLAGREITPDLARVTVTKRDAGVAWGSVHWQYLEDMSRVTPYAGTPLKLSKVVHRRQATERGPVLDRVEGSIAVGDELVVRLELRVDRDMEYVHLKDFRASGVEPVNVLSGYRYQDGLAYYEQTRDTATHFFIDYMPKGTYVFEYPVRVQHRGRYQSGVAEIQCMYAPEFGTHSGSVALEVK